MAYNPRHPKIHNTGISAIVESISEAHKNAQTQRTSNTGSHFFRPGMSMKTGSLTALGQSSAAGPMVAVSPHG